MIGRLASVSRFSAVSRYSLISGQRLSFSSSRLINSSAEPIPIPKGEAGKDSQVSSKITSIVDEISKLTLLETSQLVESLKSRLNITEAVHVSAAPVQAVAESAPEPEAKPVEKSEYTVKLDKFDPTQKAKVIREIKALLPELNLVAAKKFVEEAPKTIKENIPKEEAEKIKATLEALGATIVLE
ncbi:hypothetical protein BB559_003852 [Furculomyces boomerangus]|uniref:Ribosomal protein L7/L12 C-terminal domain-containing protein n=1 Tax=Furculomyces boomerangus TaxID=61424 RepID=A0A2T9YI99_9FUNG|nr:hypothetical protein BB559_003852 [Furculomyces boomerangus]